MTTNLHLQPEAPICLNSLPPSLPPYPYTSSSPTFPLGEESFTASPQQTPEHSFLFPFLSCPCSVTNHVSSACTGWPPSTQLPSHPPFSNHHFQSAPGHTQPLLTRSQSEVLRCQVDDVTVHSLPKASADL